VPREAAVVVLEVAEEVTESMEIEIETDKNSKQMLKEDLRLVKIQLKRVRDPDTISQKVKRDLLKKAKKKSQKRSKLKIDQRLLLTKMLRKSNSLDGISYFDESSETTGIISCSYLIKHIIYIHDIVFK